jgi:hypothetical protein
MNVVSDAMTFCGSILVCGTPNVAPDRIKMIALIKDKKKFMFKILGEER